MSVDAVIKLVLHYVDQLVQLITAPRRYLRERAVKAEKALTGATNFLLFSIVVAFIMRLPFDLAGGDAWTRLPIMLIFYSVTAGLLGGLACFAMRILGGKAALVGHLVVFGFFSGVSVIIFTLSTVIAKAVLRVNDPELATVREDYVRAVLQGDTASGAPRFAVVAESSEVTYAMLTLLLGQVVIAVWLLVCWRALRDFNALSQPRSSMPRSVFSWSPAMPWRLWSAWFSAARA